MGPLTPVPRKFPHRKNHDGTYDSICPVCAVTVASKANEDELFVYERKHVCDPNRLGRLKKRPLTANESDPKKMN